MDRDLDPVEVRVLGCLIEKQRTTPDQYPLSLNALRNACNQTTNRNPIVSYDEEMLRGALQKLGRRRYSRLTTGHTSRAAKYRHLLDENPGLSVDQQALLAVLMLRGPQTAAELRANCERLHRFADISAVEGFLDELQDKTPPHVRKLPRAPGAREARWAHLLCGEPHLDVSVIPEPLKDEVLTAAEQLAAIKAEQARLLAQMEELRATVVRLSAALGTRKEG